MGDEEVFAGCVGVVLGEGLGDDFAYGAAGVWGDFLGEVGKAQVGLADDFAGVGFEGSGDDFQQGGLAFAVASGDAGAVAWMEGHGDMVEDGVGAEGDGDVV